MSKTKEILMFCHEKCIERLIAVSAVLSNSSSFSTIQISFARSELRLECKDVSFAYSPLHKKIM